MTTSLSKHTSTVTEWRMRQRRLEVIPHLSIP